ncbi:RNA-binding domain-containing protein [Dyadobacter jiangsuensis]
MMKDVLNDLLLLSTENEVVEFKEAKTQFDRDKLGQYFSAISNEANLKGIASGWIVFGVKDDKTVVGTTISDAQLNDYKNEIAQRTSPRLTFDETARVEVAGKTVILCRVPAAPQGQPVSWKGHYYGRDGESLGALNQREYDSIRDQRTVFDWSAQIIQEATLDDLAQEAILKAREQFKLKNPGIVHEIESWNDEVFLNKAKITIQGKITNAAIILLGKPESQHFISPATTIISWILKDRDNLEKDYQHFSCPLILNVDAVYAKIRNLKFRYLQEGTLFPDEVDQYDPYIIREALNNSIAHQDYTLGGRINIVEKESGELIFSNLGAFIPSSIEAVVEADAPELKYRNHFLAHAMVSLNMIDTIGSGIKRMFVIQKNKFFPLPDYDLSDQKVSVKITGKVVDANYARRLAEMPDLSLHDIMLLDKVAKHKTLSDEEISKLKSKNLIEGRKPNFHISARVAKNTNQKGAYIKLKGIDNDYIKKIILDSIKELGEIKRSELENVLIPKISEGLDISQKKDKIKNCLQKLRNEGVIVSSGKMWRIKS